MKTGARQADGTGHTDGADRDLDRDRDAVLAALVPHDLDTIAIGDWHVNARFLLSPPDVEGRSLP